MTFASFQDRLLTYNIFELLNMKKPFQPQSGLFKVLSHPVRLAILEILRDGEQCVCHMEAMLKLRQAYISQHLMVLREAGLLADRRDGWNMYYRVTKPEVYAVLDAVNSLTGSRAAIAHRHARGECPCPKCQASSKVIPGDSAAVRPRTKLSV